MRRGTRLAGAALAVATVPAVPAVPTGAAQETGPPGEQPPPYVAEALSLFRSPPDVFHVREILARWSADAGLRDPRDSLLAARLWGRAFEPRQALAWLPEPDDPTEDPDRAALSPLLRLERARLLLTHESGRVLAEGTGVPDSLPGAADFRAACAAAEGETARELWLDLRSLLTPEEREAWLSVGTPAERCSVAQGAIEDRAVRSALTPDERLAVHYRQLATARARYWISRPRFMITASDYRGRPDSLEVDDRGYLLVRLGEPDDVAYSTDATGEELLGIEAEIGLGIEETWVYERPSGTWLFHFSPGLFQSGHVLVESFGPLATPGTDFFQRYVTRLALDPLPLKRKAFSLRSADALDARLDAVEARMRGRQEQMLARELQTRAITEVPDVPDLAPGVNVAFEPLRFWTPSRGEATVWFVATARWGDLAAVRVAEGVERRAVELRLAHGSPGRMDVRSEERRLDAAAGLDPDAGVDLWLKASLTPGRVPYTLVLRDRGAPGSVGNWIQDTLNVPDFGGARGSLLPALSDVAVAPDSGGAWTRDGRVFLPVTAAHVTGPGGTAHVYFEAYGIRPGATYAVEVRLVPEKDAERLWRLDPGDVAYRVSFDSEMPAAGSGIGRHHLRLELGGTRAGSYLLGVRATKSATGEQSLPVTTPLTVLGRD
ncbi:MAG: hypothetical protein R6X22_03610 [Gemmatimonadota bacterium]